MTEVNAKRLLVVLLADRSTHENEGRALHALLYAKQAADAGMDAELIFDGGGVEWAVAFAKEDSHLHALYAELLERGIVKGVCTFCAHAFKVEDELKALGSHFISETASHPDIGARAARGEVVITL